MENDLKPERVTWWYDVPCYLPEHMPPSLENPSELNTPPAFRGQRPSTRDDFERMIDKVRWGYNYDPRTGDLSHSHIPPMSPMRLAAKSSRDGYKRARLYDRIVSHAALVWLLHYGKWPVGKLRRLNGEMSDDRIENLIDPAAARPESAAERAVRRALTNEALAAGRPIPRPRRAPSRGVARCGPDHWQAYYRKDGKQHALGRFKTEAEALAARAAWDAQEAGIGDLV